MATGYTHPVCEGEMTEFPLFAMRCARAFGALVTMRDDPMDAPIPYEFEPSDYHEKQLIEARERLAEIAAMSPSQIEAEALADYIKAKTSHDEYEAKEALADERLDEMLVKVRAWQPPTPDHQKLKNFMVNQLTMSKRGEWRAPEPERLPPAEWRAKRIIELRRDIEFHAAGHAAEIQRAKSQTDWLKALRESLSAEPSHD